MNSQQVQDYCEQIIYTYLLDNDGFFIFIDNLHIREYVTLEGHFKIPETNCSRIRI